MSNESPQEKLNEAVMVMNKTLQVRDQHVRLIT